jgi:hypothetical protein
MAKHWIGSTCLLECPPGSEYDEEAFQYFLGLEQARADRTYKPIRVLLASLEPMPNQSTAFPRANAERVFAGLRLTLRDTDVVGWYRQDHIAGAVLSFPATAATDVSMFERRIETALRRRLPAPLAQRLRLRMVQPESVAFATA